MKILDDLCRVILYFLLSTVEDVVLLYSLGGKQHVLCKKQSVLFLLCSNISLLQSWGMGREALNCICPSKDLTKSQINVRSFFGLGIKSDSPSPVSLCILSL